MGKKMGAPTKYKEEYCKKIIEYFRDFEMFDEIPVDKQHSDGSTTTTMKQIPARPPSLTKFGSLIGVHFDTLCEWKKVHPNFSDSYRQAKKIYEDIMRDGGLMGLYKENFTKLVMMHNFDYSEKREDKTEITTPTGINIKFKKSDES